SSCAWTTSRAPPSPPPRKPSEDPRCGTSAPTTSRTSSRSATRRAPTPPSPPRFTSCGAATSSRACTPSTWSRAARSASTIPRAPPGALGVHHPGDDRYPLHADVQYPHRVRNALASSIFQVPEHQIRVIAGDIGGAFGTKGWQYPEHRLTLWAARKLGRPVKWACERREAIPADEHARDNVSDAELALDADGRFLALRVKTLANVGAYVSSDRNLLATFSNVPSLVGVYVFPVAHAQVLSVLTNTNSTAPYRGAGRPESTYVIERLIDDVARIRGIDRVELRRRNLIAPTA